MLIVDRFDRDGDHRVGYVSAMTMLEATDGDDAQLPGHRDVIEEHSPARQRRPATALAADRVLGPRLQHR